jgi:glycosyltransferase involved in cell wall biosynthesis
MSKKIKILYTSVFGGLTGGGQQSILLLLKHLDREKYQPVLVSSEGGELCEAAKAMGIFTVVQAPYGLRSLNFIRIARTLKDLKKLVIEQGIDLIHTDSPRWTFYLGIIAGSLKIPLVYHARVATPEPGFYERIIYAISSKVIAVSGFVAKRFGSFPKAGQKVDVIYNAVDTQAFSPQRDGSGLRGELGIGREVLVGLIGQLSPNKGGKEFLQAAAEVAESYRDVRFVIIGDDAGGYQRELEDLVRQLSLERSVAFCPPRRDMPGTMAALDLLVNASHLEGFSRVIVEAMASGKAVVATRSGGNPEAVLDNVTGILVPVKDPASLAQAILLLAEDEQRRHGMGLAGRKYAQEHFSVDAQIKRIENLYEQLMG